MHSISDREIRIRLRAYDARKGPVGGMHVPHPSSRRAFQEFAKEMRISPRRLQEFLGRQEQQASDAMFIVHEREGV